MITGYVYSSTSDTIGTEPGTLQLTDCLNYCQSESACQSVNFETGLCVLFNSSASIKSQTGGASGTFLRPSQFPVFTIYAQKICLSPATKGKCSGLDGATSTSSSLSRSWSFERVINHELRSKYGRKRIIAIDKIECMNTCLMESEFDCRSFNYNYKTSECILSNHDRHTLSLAGKSSKHFLPSNGQEIDYFESNCVQGKNIFSILFHFLFSIFYRFSFYIELFSILFFLLFYPAFFFFLSLSATFHQLTNILSSLTALVSLYSSLILLFLYPIFLFSLSFFSISFTIPLSLSLSLSFSSIFLSSRLMIFFSLQKNH